MQARESWHESPDTGQHGGQSMDIRKTRKHPTRRGANACTSQAHTETHTPPSLLSSHSELPRTGSPQMRGVATTYTAGRGSWESFSSSDLPWFPIL